MGLLLITIGLTIFVSCSEEPEAPAENERLILIYAVASNNLDYYLRWDMQEILDAAPRLDLKNNKVLVYSVNASSECTIKELVRDSDSEDFEFKVIYKFDDEPLSTTSSRMKEVMEYVSTNYSYQRYGLVLWSHASGWVYWPNPEMKKASNRKAFGMDNYNGSTYELNITDLAEAIPDNMFDFIWFDCCYMGNIETVYQLRNKATYVIGSVMEINNPGAPYDLIMPSLLKKNADLNKAAAQFFEYYNSGRSGYPAIASISVMNTANLSELADASRDVFRNYSPGNMQNVQDYSRYEQKIDGTRRFFPFYDLGQYLQNFDGLDMRNRERVKRALDDVVEYKAITTRDFKNQTINVEEYSGLSVHDYTGTGYFDDYYQSLDWYKATR